MLKLQYSTIYLNFTFYEFLQFCKAKNDLRILDENKKSPNFKT
jgi:hypothetical protein